MNYKHKLTLKSREIAAFTPLELNNRLIAMMKLDPEFSWECWNDIMPLVQAHRIDLEFNPYACEAIALYFQWTNDNKGLETQITSNKCAKRAFAECLFKVFQDLELLALLESLSEEEADVVIALEEQDAE